MAKAEVKSDDGLAPSRFFFFASNQPENHGHGDGQSAVVADLSSKEILYPALRKVIRLYPELAMVTFCRPSEQKKGQHRRWVGFLTEINLEDHVRFLELPPDEVLSDALIERHHDIWFENEDKTPPWLLVVVNGSHAMFVLDHIITDGRGAMEIHKSLLQALNRSDDDDDKPSPIVRLSPDIPGFPEPDSLTRLGTDPSVVTALLMFLLVTAIRLLNKFTDPFFHDARCQTRKLTYTNPEKESNLVKTQIRTLRLDAETVKRCLQACRAHNRAVCRTGLLSPLLERVRSRMEAII